MKRRDFPGGPVAKSLRSQCRGPRFSPCSGNMLQLKSPCAATKSSAAKIIKEGDVRQVQLSVATFKNAQHITAP